ncbi:MAG: hypothetical protein HY682_09970 [Chloroflexi bacterium]|nr:hypothetical protein [Chloroflexota bacterium]
MAAVFELAREINRAKDEGRDAREAQATLKQLGGDVLGLNFEPPRIETGPANTEIEALVAKRDQLRAARRYADADAVRKELLDRGVALMDSAEGTRWERVKK